MKKCKGCEKEITEGRSDKKYCTTKCRSRSHMREWRAKNPERNKQTSRRAKIKKAYSISLEEYDKIFKSQGGLCAICYDSEKGKRLAVDHCHSTGKIRGLLCQTCNRGLGMFYDNPVLLRRAISYVGVLGYQTKRALTK